MSYSLRFRPEIVSDLADARHWYASRSPSLAAAFNQECATALERIRRNPEWCAPAINGIRSMRIQRFPYLVHYRIDGDMIVVFAIVHGGREASSWKARI